MKRVVKPVIALLLATALWLPALHWIFRPDLATYRRPDAIGPQAQALANRHLNLWENPALRDREIAAMRGSNAEWDFMGRTYVVLALSNMAIAQPSEQPRLLGVIDQIIDETLRLEREKGQYFFLMDYARTSKFRGPGGRSVFLDGEIAMTLAARQLIAVEPRYAPLLAERVDFVVASMEGGPVLCGESYPDECWMFCNALAVAAVKMSDHVDRRDHGAFINNWLAMVKSKLVHPQSGLLISSFTYDGQPLDGPEGSSIWMVAHCLQWVDPEFAADQYRRARAQIGCDVMGFGYAREWPASWVGPMDVDSGPIIPVFGASAGSSGLAILGASSFGDDAYLRKLLTTLNFAGFPVRDNGALSFAASNQVGDAVLLYAMVEGPLRRRAMNGASAAPEVGR